MVQANEDPCAPSEHPGNHSQELHREHHEFHSPSLREGQRELVLLLLHEDRPLDRQEV